MANNVGSRSNSLPMDWNRAFLINLLNSHQRACAGWKQGLPPASPCFALAARVHLLEAELVRLGPCRSQLANAIENRLQKGPWSG